MTNIKIEEIKRLRELTGVGITDAKKALVAAKGNFDNALAAMRKKGLTKAEKRGEREARAGVIGTYNHDNRIGVLVEINCETDFVARTDLFSTLVKDISMQIAASAPQYVQNSDIPSAIRDSISAELAEKVKSESKPKEMVSKIVNGMVEKYFTEQCLLDQPFVKNPEITVNEYIKEHIAKLGENIVVRRFVRFVLGEV